MSKTPLNQSPKASQKLVDRALAIGLDAKVLIRSKAGHRKSKSYWTSTYWSPQKVVEIDGKRFSIGGAKQYIAAREKRNAPH